MSRSYFSPAPASNVHVNYLSHNYQKRFINNMHSSVLSNVNDYLQDKSQQIQELKGENTAHLKNKIQVAQSLIQQCENLRNSFTHQVTSAKENNELLLAYLSKLELEFSNAKNELDNIAKQKHAQKVVTAISQQLLIRQ